ncbi:hypothetical protein LIER_33720 [Lithospermum erythrorhizon]|uniref:SBP-type domain-containing protein n=1 Tax=Lithospermum erythrorhizon TaxID=34254 RepID=A0AAV3S1K1_LITER
MQNPNFPLPPPPENFSDELTTTNPSSSLFDWSDFLDFGIDDTLSFPSFEAPDNKVNHENFNNFDPNTHSNDHIINLSGIGSEPIDLEGVDFQESVEIDGVKNQGVDFQESVELDEGVENQAVDFQESVQRVRKRDPRLGCSNFMAGRVPCACPEMDAKLEEEEMRDALAPGKKRARVGRSSRANTGRSGVGLGVAMMRCQVPECEVDISELKGYHKRHRVCLKCANASFVVLDGESKRYCQQCGKFHILPDFDEGKRSCRRKLERHNNRRRRKPADSKGGTEKEQELILATEDVSCDDDRGKEEATRSQPVGKDELVGSEGQLSALGLIHGSQTIQTAVSYTASGEAPTEAEKGNLTSTCSPTAINRSPSDGDNRSAFSSVCPTGRISFKLYDWNPAEFPRRLRNQIFQWLASMPVELEGYIRPGCIIFTVFIAMPKPTWVKLAKDPVQCLHNFIMSPRNLLNGRGTMLVYLNNMILHVMKDGTSVTEVKAREMAPRLHYVYPTCFVAGKPIEFVACGSNLLQSNLRFLFSFSGKYLACKGCVSSFHNEIIDSSKSVDHQVVKVCVTETASDVLGPAFIEVENEFGLSNFIPVLIGNQEICTEMKLIQQRLGISYTSKRRQLAPTCSLCDVSVSQQLRLSEFILDVAWLLREPLMDDLAFVPSTQIRRFIHLTKFLIENESSSILARVLHSMKVLVERNPLTGVSDVDMRLFWSNIDIAKDKLSRRKLELDSVMMAVNFPVGSSTQTTCVAAAPTSTKGLGEAEELKSESRMDLSMLYKSAIVPLLDKKASRSEKTAKVWRGRSSSSQFGTGSLFSSKRSAIFAMTAVAVCLGVCVVFLHPQKVERITTTIRMCLFENSS